MAIGSGASAQSATNNQGIINYRDASGVGIPAAGTGGNIQNGANGSTTPPGAGETSAGAQPSGTAIGKKSTVGAAGGVAVGYDNSAGTGTFNSTAIGANNDAAGSYGVAIGYANIATGRSTLSLGTNNQALGDVAIALGRQSYAVGDFSFAQGFIASAYGQDALALGRLSVAGETGSNPTASNIAIGDNARAVGGSALALGSGASATKARSVALGAGSMALRGSLSGTEAYTTNTLSSANGEVSVGAQGAERQITNVAGGQQDTDAVNVRQLRSVGSGVTKNATALGGSFGSDGTYTPPSYSYNGRSYATVPGVVGALDQLALRYDTDGSGNRLASIDLTRAGTVGSAVRITGLAPGSLAAGSTDAVNGDQLYALRQSIDDGTFGLVRQDPTSRAIRVAAATDGALVDFRNSAGTGRVLSGVSAGSLAAGSDEAVNGGQLYATNQAVAGLSAGLANGSVGLVKQDAATRGLTVGAETDGTTVSFADRDGTARTLTGVSGGRVALGSTDAVSGGQVYGLSASLARSLGGGSSVAADGSVTAPSYVIQGSSFGDVGSALGSLDAAVTTLNTAGSRYVAVRSTGAAAQATATDSLAIGPASVASVEGGVALGANAVARRTGLSGAAEAFSGITVASTAGAVSVGAEGAERQIVNVAGGTQETDAVNLRQLRAVGGKLADALGGGAGFAADGSFTAPTYALGGRSYSGVGDALAAVDAFAVKYDVDPATGGRGQSMTLAGSDPNQPVLIRNVAAGVQPTDAANLGQVTAQVATAKAQSFAYTDQRVQASYAAGTAYTDARVAPLEKQANAFGSQLAGLQNEVGQVRQEARRGAAIGLAAASLRFDDRPGKLSMAAGGGVWRGEGAASMGVGYTLPDGSARVNATGVAAGRDFGIGAGASFTLN